MPTISDYLLQTTSSGVTSPRVGVFVRFTNNVTSVQFVSSSFTDSNGLYTMTNIPAGIYTVAFGPSSIGSFTNTGDTAYAVGQSPGDHLIASGTAPTISGVNAGISGTPTIVGNDQAAVISFTTTGAPPSALTPLFNATFATPYAFTPVIILTPVNNPGAFFQYFPNFASTTGFQYWTVSTLTATTAYVVAYFIIQHRVV